MKPSQSLPRRRNVCKKMDELGIAITPMSPTAFTAFVKEQVAQLGPAVKAAGVRL